jgi:hypothetical protein
MEKQQNILSPLTTTTISGIAAIISITTTIITTL